MRSDGFEYLKENCPLLQSELLKTVVGCEEEASAGKSVWAQYSDGDDTNGRSVRQQIWEANNPGDRNQNLWVQLPDDDGAADTGNAMQLG